MKDQILDQLRQLENQLRSLRDDIKKLKVEQVSRKELRSQAESLADTWVEKIRSPMEHRFKLPPETINKYAEYFKRLHILSRPNNKKQSYIKCINSILKKIKDELLLPIQQSEALSVDNPQLALILNKVTDKNVSDYLAEAISCAQHGFTRASIVMGWCAATDHIHKKLVMLGLNKFNETSIKLKSSNSGRFKRFNKEFKVTTLNELQEIFDSDLIWILEGMGLIDSNQGDRLNMNLQYRNQSAHPGEAPINSHHLNAFFSDIVEIVLANSKFALVGGGIL